MAPGRSGYLASRHGPNASSQSTAGRSPRVPAEYLPTHLTHEGDVVCNPLMDVGTYGEVAVKLGREFIGVEADHDQFREGAAPQGRHQRIMGRSTPERAGGDLA